MAQPAQATTDRLPWLSEVPRTPPPVRKRRRFPWEWVVAGLLVLLAALGAYWLVTRHSGQAGLAPSTAEKEVSRAAPDGGMTEIPSVSDMTQSDVLTAEPIEAADQTASQQEVRRPVRRATPRQPQPDSEPAVAEAGPAAEIAIPAQPVVRGRIIQIGAYPTREEADVAWRYVVRKWPYLASKPKLISPIEVRSTDGKGTRMYRLQLATASQAQSAVICQRLETSKVSCVVVY